MTERGGATELAPGSVKIDGLREVVHAEAAAAAGADLIGFIFADARRRVTPEVARACIEAARLAAPGPLLTVGVFVDAGAEEMNETAERAGLDLLQLHGGEPPALLKELWRPVLKALRPPAGTSAATVMAEMERFAAVGNAPIAFLVDGYAAGVAGGAGVRADWGLVGEVARAFPVMLAGGLRVENVAEAVVNVGPLGVDVSSGVERDGVKDVGLIEAFVREARRGFGR